MTCAVAACERPAKTRGYCGKHVQRFYKYGDPEGGPIKRPPIFCSVEGCQKRRHVRSTGLCDMHQHRLKRGIPLDAPKLTPGAQFELRFTKSDDGCWLWNGYIPEAGYVRYHKTAAHRYSYERYVGPIPDGLQLDHLCRVRHCVNPDHLEPVTPAENTRRGTSLPAMTGRTGTCQRGHEFSGDNVYVARNGRRQCIPCRKFRDQQKRELGAAA